MSQNTPERSRANVQASDTVGQLEILLFKLGAETFGINVAKVREVIRYTRPTPSPGQGESVLGMIDLRGKVMPLISLHHFLSTEPTETEAEQKVIVTEFYGVQSGFVVDSVEHIHRVPIDSIRPMRDSIEKQTAVNSILEIGERLVLMLDFESVVDQIDPRCLMHADVDLEAADEGFDRSAVRIFLAEDSRLTRQQVQRALTSGGYTNVTTFDNGRDCWTAIEAGSGTSPCDLLISDIEMPQLDGYGLCRNIKKSPNYASIPVILFSSLISDATRFRGNEVGADEQITKPQLPELVSILDRVIQAAGNPATPSKAA